MGAHELVEMNEVVVVVEEDQALKQTYMNILPQTAVQCTARVLVAKTNTRYRRPNMLGTQFSKSSSSKSWEEAMQLLCPQRGFHSRYMISSQTSSIALRLGKSVLVTDR